MLKKSLIAAGAAALLMPAAAHAQSARAAYDDYTQGYGDSLTVTGEAGSDVRQHLVALDDLDLRRDRDVRIAESRVRRAAARVCSVGKMNGSVVREEESGCYADAFSTARVDLNGRIADQRIS